MQDILDRIKVLERTIQEMGETGRLMIPLVTMLLPFVRKADASGLPKEGRRVRLSKITFPEQSDKSINRVLGIDIDWV